MFTITGAFDPSGVADVCSCFPGMTSHLNNDDTVTVSFGDPQEVVSRVAKGFFAGMVCFPLFYSIELGVEALTGETFVKSSMQTGNFAEGIASLPMALLFPMMEEMMFRGFLEESLKGTFASLYEEVGLPYGNAPRITATFFSAVLFGLSHFPNARYLNASLDQVVPQVVMTTVMGFLLSAAKEATGSLACPIGMHMGHNAMGTAYANVISHTL